MKFPISLARPKYSEHLDTIVALITHLAYSEHTSRTIPNLTKALSVDADEVVYTLENFKALFRKSQGKSVDGQHFYGLHIRHARIWMEVGDEAGTRRDVPLDTASVNALLDFVVNKADHESRTSLGLGTARLTALASLLVALIALFKT